MGAELCSWIDTATSNTIIKFSLNFKVFVIL